MREVPERPPGKDTVVRPGCVLPLVILLVGIFFIGLVIISSALQ